MNHIKLFEEMVPTIPVPKKKWLYHVTNAKHLASIKQVGLIPEWGEVVRDTYGDSYDFDNRAEEFGGNNRYYDEGQDEGEENNGQYDHEGNRKIQLPFDGILFFAEEPHIMYSHFTKMEDFNWNDVVIAIVKNNKTIYRKSDSRDADCVFMDNKGQLVGDIKYGWNYVDIHELPIIIERGDYFSLEEQEPLHILYGEQAKTFVTQYFPEQIATHTGRHPHIGQ